MPISLLKILGRGLFVVELMGTVVNPVTGDYSSGGAGFWVDGGIIQYPVSEFSIAGNLRQMYRDIVAVGADAYTTGHSTIGSVLIESMRVAGSD